MFYWVMMTSPFCTCVFFMYKLSYLYFICWAVVAQMFWLGVRVTPKEWKLVRAGCRDKYVSMNMYDFSMSLTQVEKFHTYTSNHVLICLFYYLNKPQINQLMEKSSGLDFQPWMENCENFATDASFWQSTSGAKDVWHVSGWYTLKIFVVYIWAIMT